MKPWTLSLVARPLARDSLWMLASNGFRLLLHGATFLLVARVLGAEGFGTFATALSFASVFSPFASLGAGNILVRDLAREPGSFPVYWGRALCSFVPTCLAALSVCLALGWLLLSDRIPLRIVVELGLADLVFARLTELGGQAFQGAQKLHRTALIQIVASAYRLLPATVVAATGTALSAEGWALLYVLFSAAGTLTALGLVHREMGRPSLSGRWTLEKWGERSWFSLGAAAQNVYNDGDKIVLARAGGLEAVGIYATAYRIVDFTFAPVSALLAASYPRFFRAGGGGIEASLSLARRLLRVGLLYAFPVSLLLALGAPLVPTILGPGYAESATALRWLALLTTLRAFHYLAADSLTGAGYQWLRTLCQAFVAVLNIVACLQVVPVYSWRGAAAVSLVSDATLAIALWTIASYLRSRGSRSRKGDRFLPGHGGTRW